MSRHYSSRRRTGADRFGILTFFLLLISSGFLAARLLTTGVLTQKLTLLLLSVLAGLNVLFAVTQLPRWRNKLWKLVLGVVALVLSAGMIYATVATNAVLETLSRVSSTGSVKTVVVRECGIIIETATGRYGKTTPLRRSVIPSAIPTAIWLRRIPTPPMPF